MIEEISFQVEAIHDQAIPAWMLKAHYEESGKFNDALKLKPDWDFYMEEQARGRFFLVVARARTGEMVGYMAMFLRRHPHYAESKVAIDDLHYLMPSYRSQGIGKKLIAYAEKIAANAGATIFSMRCKAAEPHGGIFEKMGYKLTDLVYVKDIRDAK